MNRTDKLAETLSKLLSPVVIAFFATVIFTFATPIKPSSYNPCHSLLIGVIFLAIAPIISILYFYQRGVVDLWVSDQKMRTPFYLVAIIGYVTASIIFFILHYQVMLVLSMAYVWVTTVVMIANLFWKVSSHSAGVAGPLTGLAYVYGLIALPLFLLVPMVIWVRKQLAAHTLTQLITGAAIAIFVTLIVYHVFYP
jgi:membrane-associated phospholipid phosphatase